jgi:NAD(P)-dependent dehydrogenase (short-subunit alcohol dehydrogenase family)
LLIKFIDLSSLFSLKDKVAVITGGAGVLGSAMAKGLTDAGAKVCIISRTKSKIDLVTNQLNEGGGESIGIPTDVLNRSELESAREHILNHWGKIDILVNCAGGNMKGATIMPDQQFFDVSMDDFDKVTDLNLKGTVLPSVVFGESIAAQKHGSIVNISSMAASQAITRILGYSASKAAVDNFTKWLAVELANKHGEGIRVNAIAPGFFIAEQNRRLLLNDDNTLTSRGQTIVNETPMKRFGKPEELVSTLLWLCSDASSFVTGIIVPVDGGFSAFSGV